MVTILLVAVCVATILGIVWIFRRGYIVSAAVALWALYVLYEIRVQSTCTGECNIRVDLVFIAPLLLVVTLLAAGALVARLLRKKSTPR